MSWQLRVLPGAQQGHCIPRKDCVGHTKTQVHLVYSPPTKLPGGSTKTLDVKLHTGCPSNIEVNWKQSGEQERWCPPKDGHVPFSTTGQPCERRSSKEGCGQMGAGTGWGASRPTCPGRGAPDPMPHPGEEPPDPASEGQAPDPCWLHLCEEDGRKTEANQPRMRRTERLPTVQKARSGTACGPGGSLMFPGSGAHPACTLTTQGLCGPLHGAPGRAQLRPCKPLAKPPGWGAVTGGVFGTSWAWGQGTPAWAHSQAWPTPPSNLLPGQASWCGALSGLAHVMSNPCVLGASTHSH